MTTILNEIEETPAVTPPRVTSAPNKPKRKAISGKTVAVLFFSFQPLFLSAVMLPATGYVIRGLGPEHYGQWATATTIIALVSYLTNLGLRGTFVRDIAREPEHAETTFANQLGLRLALSFVAALIAVIVCWALRFSSNVLICTIIGAIGIILGSATSTATDLLQGLHRFSTVAVINIVSGLVVTGTSVAIIWSGRGIIWVASSYLLGAVASAIFQFIIITRAHFHVRIQWKAAVSKDMLWKARFFAIQQFAQTASQNGTALFFSSFLGPASFGFLTAGSLLADRLSVLPDGLATAAYPAVAKADRAGHSAVLRTIFHYLAGATSICLMASIAVFSLAWPIAAFLFPRDPETCAMVIRITIWLLPIAAVQLIIGYSLNALHKDAGQAMASSLAVISHLVASTILVWNYGLPGACWAMVLRPVFQLAFIVPLMIRVIKRSAVLPAKVLSS